MTGRPRRHWLRWVVGVWVLLVVLSDLWRWTHPFVPVPRPTERVVPVGAVRGSEVVPGTVRIATLDVRPDSAPATDRLPIILIHGSPGSNNEVSRLTHLLGARRRAVAPDLPGFGGSTHDVPDYSFLAHARYVLELMDSLGIRRANVLGFSMGGGVALSMASLAPDRVASLTLLSAIGAQEYELLGDYYLNHVIHGLQLAGIWLLREAVPHFGALDEGLFGMLNVEYARNFYDSDQRPLRDILSRYAGPALIIQGDHDPLVQPAIATEHARLLPQSELVMLHGPAANHFMAFARASDLAPVLDGFLDSVDAGTAVTRATADPARLAAAARPFDPRVIPPVSGLSLSILLVLLAVATLVSEDLACIAAGLLIGRGSLGFVAGTTACAIGIIGGDLLLFAAGRWIGRPAVRRAPLRWLVSDADIDRSSAWFRRYGAWIALITRFVPGTRLPTYLTAGILHTRALAFLGVFVLASALWTPALVGVSALFGSRVLTAFSAYQRLAMPTLLGVALLLLIVVKLVVPLFSWRGRRLLVSRWRRLTRWEYWPRWAFYPPVALYVLWLALRHRSLTVWTAANPAIPGGGFVGESKAEILAGLAGAGDRIARWRLLAPGGALTDRMAAVQGFMAEHGLDFPVVLKPDVGERGDGVAIVRDLAAAEAYLARTVEPILIQEYVPGIEMGVFYYRIPGEERGRLFALTDKRLPVVVGDGTRSLEELILADDRAVGMARWFLTRHATRLATVPAAGETVPLVELGTHCRGAAFFDGERVRTPALEAAIDEVSKTYRGFWFGRFDVKAPSYEALSRGDDFRVLELNGATSEATSIYDPANSLFSAYRVLFRQWALLFEIGARNRAAGATPATLRQLVDLMRRHRRAGRAHVEAA